MPIPPNYSRSVKTDADLMWLQGYKADAHHVYFGKDAEQLEHANTASNSFKGTFENNIFTK